MQTLHSSASLSPPSADAASPAALAMLSPRANATPLFELASLDTGRERALLNGAYFLEIGEAFSAELRVHGAPLARLEGRVVDLRRGTEPGMQVAFENITPAVRDALAQIGAAGTR